MRKDIYDSLTDTKKGLWAVTNSEHVGVWLDYNKENCNQVLGFIEGHFRIENYGKDANIKKSSIPCKGKNFIQLRNGTL